METSLRHIMFDRLWHVWICFVFRNCHVNGTTFKIKAHLAWNLFLFSLKLLSETSLLLRRTRGNIIIVVRSSRTVLIFLSDFQQSCISRQILIKTYKINFHKNRYRGVRDVSWEQLDRRTDRQLTKLLVAFAPKKPIFRGTLLEYFKEDISCWP
jgi:hypothetical protein